jgi:hypothetical protein
LFVECRCLYQGRRTKLEEEEGNEEKQVEEAGRRRVRRE